MGQLWSTTPNQQFSEGKPFQFVDLSDEFTEITADKNILQKNLNDFEEQLHNMFDKFTTKTDTDNKFMLNTTKKKSGGTLSNVNAVIGLEPTADEGVTEAKRELTQKLAGLTLWEVVNDYIEVGALSKLSRTEQEGGGETGGGEQEEQEEKRRGGRNRRRNRRRRTGGGTGGGGTGEGR